MREVFYIYGMSCAMCKQKIENKLNSYPGVNAQINLGDGRCIIEYDEDKYSTKLFKDDIKKLGYKTNIPSKKYENFKLIVSIVITIYFIVTCFITNKFDSLLFLSHPHIHMLLSVIMISLIGFGFIKRSISDIKNKSFGMDILVSIGIIASFLLSLYNLFFGTVGYYFLETAMIPTIVTIGKRIEGLVKHETLFTQSSFKKNISEVATLVDYDDDDIEELSVVSINKISIGQTILVKQGEVIPLDGIIIKGSCSVDDRVLTGESKYKQFKIGDSVLAASVVVEGTIYVKVTKKVTDTLISKILEKVDDASMYKPHIERLTSKIASIFVPTVIIIALICGVITGLISGFKEGIIRFLTVELVSCPCALGLATPMAILVGSNKALKEGIIFRSGEFLEYSRNIKTICFDKTKTLTKGEFEIVSTTISPVDIKYLVSLEKLSNHPLSFVILKEYSNIQSLSVTDFKVLPGIGISGHCLDYDIVVRSYDDSELFTTIELLVNNTSKGIMRFSDSLKEESIEVVNSLKSRGIDVIMLTGDNASISKDIATKLNIDKYYSSQTPLDKAKIIETLNKDSVTGFVGDGVNDALAIKEAGVGFSFMDATDASISASDVVLLKNDLRLVKNTIDISKEVYNNIVVNLLFAFVYNIVAIPLACFGILNPVLSTVMMGLSNILVVTNSLRIRFKKIK